MVQNDDRNMRNLPERFRQGKALFITKVDAGEPSESDVFSEAGGDQ